MSKTIGILYNPIVDKNILYSLILWLFENSRNITLNKINSTINIKGCRVSKTTIKNTLKTNSNLRNFVFSDEIINRTNIKKYETELNNQITQNYIRRVVV